MRQSGRTGRLHILWAFSRVPDTIFTRHKASSRHVDKRSLSSSSLASSFFLSSFLFLFSFLLSFFSPLRTSSPSSRVPSRVSERTKDREIRGKRFRNLAALVRRGAKPSLMAPSERALADGNINFRDLPSLLFFLVFPFPLFLVFFFLLLFLLFFSFFEDRILLQHCRLFVADSDALSSDTAIRNRGLIYGQFVTVRFPWIFLWSDIARDFFFPPFCCTLDRFQDIPVFLISWCKVENNKWRVEKFSLWGMVIFWELFENDDLFDRDFIMDFIWYLNLLFFV